MFLTGRTDPISFKKVFKKVTLKKLPYLALSYSITKLNTRVTRNIIYQVKLYLP